jgi:hypothetical protein
MQNTHATPDLRPPDRKPPAYDRTRDLPRLLPLWPEDLVDQTLAGRQALVHRLRSALRRERQRGVAGDWCYDLSRHRQLVIAYRAELAQWLGLSRTFAAPPIQPLATRRHATSDDVFQVPSSSPALSAPQRSSAPPWDSRAAGPISPGILPAINCSGSADAVSEI